MLAYLTLNEFKLIKRMEDGEDLERNANEDSIITRYIARATRTIDRITHRHFLPLWTTNEYAIPAEFFDLAYREMPGADLLIEEDLLEVDTLVSGETEEAALPVTGYKLLDFNVFPKFGIRLPLSGVWRSSSQSRGGKLPSIWLTGVWGYHDEYPHSAWIDTRFSLADAIAADLAVMTLPLNTRSDPEPTLDVQGRLAFEVGDCLRVGNEFMEVLAWDSDSPTDSLVVRRAQRQSVLSEHITDDALTRWQVHQDITEVCFMIVKAWREHDAAAGGRQGVSEMSTGVELDIPKDAKEALRHYTRL